MPLYNCTRAGWLAVGLVVLAVAGCRPPEPEQPPLPPEPTPRLQRTLPVTVKPTLPPPPIASVMPGHEQLESLASAPEGQPVVEVRPAAPAAAVAPTSRSMDLRLDVKRNSPPKASPATPAERRQIYRELLQARTRAQRSDVMERHAITPRAADAIMNEGEASDW